MKYFVSFGCVFNRGSDLYLFFTFWICRNAKNVPSGRSNFKPNWCSNRPSDNVIRGGQNRVSDPIINCINKISHFSIDPVCKKSFQCLTIHWILIRCLITINVNYKKNSVGWTVLDLLLSAASPVILLWSKSSIWVRIPLVCCLLQRVETKFISTREMHLKE